MLYSIWKKAIDIVNGTSYISSQANSEILFKTKNRNISDGVEFFQLKKNCHSFVQL